jgi:aminoglycoside phosphotransferase (APT) family kinase protein
MADHSREALLAWTSATLQVSQSELILEPLVAGRSNVSFRILDRGEPRWVLRCPPPGPILESAHDLTRECRVLDALKGTNVPVPEVIAFHEPDFALPVQCYIMSYVLGWSLPDATELSGGWLDRRADVLQSMIETLALIHQVDLQSTGLANYGRGVGYIDRQLKRWLKQWQDTPGRFAERIPSIHDRLKSCGTASTTVTLVHGDFGVANLILSDRGKVEGVLDWELSTTGDPLADVGTLLIYLDRDIWRGDYGSVEREGMIRRYAEMMKLDLSAIEFYVALANWKLACIGVGVKNRYESKAINNPDIDVTDLSRAVEDYLDSAEAALERLACS